MRLKGLIAAPFTPMHPDGSLHLEIIPRYYRMLKANGVSGAFICGSTGEGVSMTFNEKMSVAESWASCTREDKDFNVITLLGGTCLKDCRELAQHARQVGLDAVAFTSPFYFRPASVTVLAETCAEVASAVPDMPFYYYHIPVLTGVTFPMIELLSLVGGRIPNFTGIKYTHEDLMDFMSCLHYDSGRYDMSWGRDENMLSALAAGASSAVGSTFNYAAPLYLDLMEAFQSGNLQKAQMLQQRSIDMIRLLGKYGGIATGKAYMKLLGLDCGRFRLPVQNMTQENFSLFEQDVELLGFREFCSQLPMVGNTV